MQLNTKAFALTAGLLWGLGLMIGTWIGLALEYPRFVLEFFVKAYPGYSISFAGSLIGLIYGFLDAFIGCYIFAWIYNYFTRRINSQAK